MKNLLLTVIILLSLPFGKGWGWAFSQNPEWIIYNKSNSGLPNNSVLCIAIDLDGKKWIGLSDTQFVSFDDSIWTVYNSSKTGLPYNSTGSIAVDSFNNKWFAMQWLTKFDGTNWTVFDTSNSPLLSGVDIISMEKQTTKWLSTMGLGKYDDVSWVFYDTGNSGLPGNWVTRLTTSSQGEKWINTIKIGVGYMGLTGYDDISWTTYNTSNSGLPSNDIRAIAIDAQGNKWIGLMANKGLVKFDGSNWTIYDTSNTCLVNGGVSAVTIDAEGTKWIGQYARLFKFNDTVCIEYNEINSDFPSGSKYVTAIAIDKYGNKWIGCPPDITGGGLAVFREGGVILSTEDKKKWETENENKIKVLVYPNPFSRSATIKITNYQLRGTNYQLTIYDLLGRTVKQSIINNQSTIINAQGLPAGMYFYRLAFSPSPSSSLSFGEGRGEAATGKLVIADE